MLKIKGNAWRSNKTVEKERGNQYIIIHLKHPEWIQYASQRGVRGMNKTCEACEA